MVGGCGCRRRAARRVECLSREAPARRCAAPDSERLGNSARTGAPCVHMSCQFPNERPLPTHVLRPQGTADRDQGVACKWLEAVEVGGKLSRNGRELLAAS